MNNIPRNLKVQDAKTREALLGSASKYFEGEWNFRGYHPVGCDEPGDCFVHTLGFT
jgi:hypothetical protein